jgi:dipeptidyl aminopeptidase/acylaminoacyl peptidase
LKTGWQVPERFVAKGRDGATDIYGVIYRPTSFDAQKKYPVIEHIYAGPHDSFVPKAFATVHGPQELAESGFVVVQIDGMGTSNRSKKFHDVCWKNLGDAGLPDRILWIKAAAAKYSQLDATRVGIYGGSAGGQSTVRVKARMRNGVARNFSSDTCWASRSRPHPNEMSFRACEESLNSIRTEV